jgi:pyridine nucleotide-disulfide oxidoreductase
MKGLPVAVIGAGPVGLAAAAHLAKRNQSFVVLEQGDEAGASIREWQHVTFFSPWKYSVDETARELLAANGWQMPEGDRDPTGRELLEHYVAPLAAHALIAPSIRYSTRVQSVTRLGMDRVPSNGRDGRPFEITTHRGDGGEDRFLARAVIDASGTWRSPNPAGASGVPASGERESASRISYGIPDVSGRSRDRYANRRVLVIGNGHSAMDAILGLSRLKITAPRTQVQWAMRNIPTARVFGGLTDDQLASRGALGERAKAAVDEGKVEIIAPFRTQGFKITARGIEITGMTDGPDTVLTVDEVIIATGFRPDFSMLSEIRLDLHPWLECPRQLGELIDPNEHSCGTVPPHGYAELSHPERDFFVVGMKSYGRAPTFLMMTGYEQVRSVVAALSGDIEAARNVRLVLPETGVCDGPGIGVPETETKASCCAPACCGGGSAPKREKTRQEAIV